MSSQDFVKAGAATGNDAGFATMFGEIWQILSLGMAQSNVNAAIARQALDKMQYAPYRSVNVLRQLL